MMFALRHWNWDIGVALLGYGLGVMCVLQVVSANNRTPEPRSGLSVGDGNAEPDGGPSGSASNVSPGRAVSLPPARPGQP
jgi:hypothetical protein